MPLHLCLRVSVLDWAVIPLQAYENSHSPGASSTELSDGGALVAALNLQCEMHVLCSFELGLLDI